MKATITLLSAMALASSLTFGEDHPAPPPHHPAPPHEKGAGDKGGDRKRPNPEEVFKKLDKNGDGSVSMEEFKAGPMAKNHPDKAEEMFKKIDADSNGSISLEEFKAHRPERKGGPGHDGPPKGDGGGAPPPPPPAE